MTHTTRETFEKSWAYLVEQAASESEAKGGRKPEGQGSQVPQGQAEKEEPKGKGAQEEKEEPKKEEPKGKKPHRGRKNPREEAPEEPNKKPRKAIDALLGKAMKLKTKYLLTTGQASAFIGQVGAEAQYNWISPDLLNPVLEAQAALSKAISGVALQIVSGVPSQTLKKQFSLQDLETQLRALPVELEPLCTRLAEEVQRLQRMHSAHRMKA